VDPESALRLGFDAVFVGEGELTLPEFLDQVAAGKTPQPLWRAARAFDIDSHVHVAPRWGLFPFVEITRGCPHACAFCSTSVIFGRRMRHRSPGTVAEGVRQAVRAGYRRFRLLSPDAFAYGGGERQQRAQRLEELLARCREAGASEIILGTYPSEVRPERVNAGILQVVKKYCRNRRVQIGAQAGSDRVLALMRRGHTVEQVRQAVRRVREAGLQPMLDVIFGFPGETFAERQATLELVRWLLEFSPSRVHLHWYTPLPGSAAWPAPAEKAEPAVVEALEELSRSRRVSGQWREQLALGERIISWRRTGLLS
jgi:B12-binding domain/radical SAM domain protein